MIDHKGKKRVIISNVSPQIDQGRFAAKAAIGELVTISADIFSDGHDELSASVFIQKPGIDNWTELLMLP